MLAGAMESVPAVAGVIVPAASTVPIMLASSNGPMLAMESTMVRSISGDISIPGGSFAPFMPACTEIYHSLKDWEDGGAKEYAARTNPHFVQQCKSRHTAACSCSGVMASRVLRMCCIMPGLSRSMPSICCIWAGSILGMPPKGKPAELGETTFDGGCGCTAGAVWALAASACSTSCGMTANAPSSPGRFISSAQAIHKPPCM